MLHRSQKIINFVSPNKKIMIMSKFVNKANELLARVESLMSSFELVKGSDGWPDDYKAKKEIWSQYPDILIDVQTLLFCDSPEHPLYLLTKKFEKEQETRYDKNFFTYSDFEKLKPKIRNYHPIHD